MVKKTLFRNVVLLNVAAALFFLGVMAYLGMFTRYMADDYCESFSVTTSSPLRAVINRYIEGQWRASNRFSNLLFVGLTERIIPNNYEVVPPVMIILWTIGLIWLIHEVRSLVGVRWPIRVDFLLGTMLAFLSMFEAPNQFQILYWRSSMSTHFVPLVFLNFLIVLLLLCIRLYTGRAVPVWMGFIFFTASFFIGGFSEPPVTLLIVGAGVSMFFILVFIKRESYNNALHLSAWILGGGITALIVMALSPAVSRLDDSPSFFEWVQRTNQYTFFFIVDTIRTLPMPTFFSLAAPAILGYVFFHEKDQINLIDMGEQRKIFYFMLAAPFLLALLIAAGFSTSAFGQSYPVDRARFFAYFLMVAAFMFEGMLLGILLSQIKHPVFRSAHTLNISLLVLLVFAYYPLRAGLQAVQQIGEYRTREQQWDERDAQIRLMISQGQTDLTIPQLSGIDGVKELDVYADHWVNRCAAQYYGVNSIQAITVK